MDKGFALEGLEDIKPLMPALLAVETSTFVRPTLPSEEHKTLKHALAALGKGDEARPSYGGLKS